MAGIRIQLELDNGDFTTRILHSGESLDDFNAKLGSTAVAFQRVDPPHRNFIGQLRDIVVVVAAARLAFENIRTITTGWAGDILKVNAQFEKLTYLLKGMSTAADPMKEATAQVKELRKEALEMPYSVAAITDTFVKLKATGIDPFAGGLRATVDAIAAFGGSESQLKRASLALQEMAGKGVVQTKELRRQLGQDIPRAVELMARALGVTVGQLSGIVEKGTLDAKTSMQAMFDEWERTFGGSAKRMMDTFNGLLSQSQTLIQNLTLEVGQAGFFDAAKQQIREMNAFLAGNQAKVLAQGFGTAMASVVQGLREALDWVVRFRNEIMGVGEVLITAFAARAAIGGILAFSSAISMLMVRLAAFRGELMALNSAFRLNQLNMLAGQLGIAGIGVTQIAGYFRMARIAVMGLGTALAFVSEFILPIVAIVGAAAYAFGLFDNKINDAYESVKKYGAASKEQLETAKQQLAVEERKWQLAQINEGMRAARLAARGMGDNPERSKELSDATAEAEARKNEVKETLAKAEREFAKQQQQAAIKDANDALDQELQVHQRAYDAEQVAREKAFQAEVDLRLKNHQDVETITKKNQETQHEEAIKDAQWHFDLLEKAIADQKELIANGKLSPDMGNATIGDFTHQQAELQQQIARLKTMPIGPQINNKGIGLDEALNKAQDMIHRLQGDLIGYKAGLAGADDELAKFIYTLEEGRNKKLNIFDNEELDGYLQRLKELKKQVDETKADFEGQSKLDHDITSLREKDQADLIEAQTRGLSGLDKILAKARLGAYTGVKPINLLAQQYGAIDSEAHKAATAMDTALGAGMQTKGRSMLGVVRDIAQAWTTVGTEAGKATPLPRAGGYTPVPRQPNSTSVPGAYSGNEGGVDYMSRLAHHESSGDPNAAATGSSAVGIGQFIEKTWMQFLAEMHPDMLAGGRESALASRTDADLSREATAWYASKNSVSLAKGGVEVNDANLYLAHFLGPDGAIAALTKSAGTLLSSIPQLRAAQEANPGVFNKAQTVGGLQDWAKSFMGGGMTAPITSGAFTQLEELLKYVQDPNAQKALREIIVDEQKLAQTRSNNKLSDFEKETRANIAAAGESLTSFGKRVSELTKQIKEGKFGTDTDVNSPRYAPALDEAKSQDAADKQREERTKLQTKALGIINGESQDLEKLAAREKELAARIAAQSTGRPLRAVDAERDKVEKEEGTVKKAGADGLITPQQMSDALANLDAIKRRYTDLDVANTILNEQKKVDALKKSLMTGEEARQFAAQEEEKRLDELLQKESANAEQRVALEKYVAQEKDLLNRKAIADSPLGKEFKSWSDAGQNFQSAAAGWMNNFTTDLAKMTTGGKVNFHSMEMSILQDIVQIAAKAAIGNMFSGMLGIAGVPGAGAIGGGAGKLAGGGAGKMGVAQHHSGGIAGALAEHRMVHPGLFARAPRFHGGGFPGLTSDEVPIIAKKGEEVGWPDQLAKKYGGGGSIGRVGHTFTSHVTVQGGGGSDGANEEMAQRVGRSVREQFGSMMQDAMYTQMRPGGAIWQMMQKGK